MPHGKVMTKKEIKKLHAKNLKLERQHKKDKFEIRLLRNSKNNLSDRLVEIRAIAEVES